MNADETLDKGSNSKEQVIQFRDWLCEIRQSQYPNGRTALLLVDANNGESIAVATANLPGEMLRPGHVFIKDHSENRGMLAALEKAGIVKGTGETAQSGFAEVPIATLLIPEYGREEFKRIISEKTEAPAVTRGQERGIER